MSQHFTPTHKHYDAIVVGARCAGAATAMLLAQQGRRVLVLDRSDEHTDTVSTHGLMRVGVQQLQRWGLLDELIEAGTPAIDRTLFRYGHRTVDVELTEGGTSPLRAPRRTVLDPVLVEAARRAGAEVRFGVTVKNIVTDRRSGRVLGVRGRARDGKGFEAHAPLTIGADGMRSRIAAAVEAPTERHASHSSAFVYSYWSGVEAAGYEWCFNDRCVGGLIPTNGDQVCIFVGVPAADFAASAARRHASEAWFVSTFHGAAPAIGHRLEGGVRSSRLFTFPGRPGYMRRAHGPGWALVGDAGYFKDPITAHGISDALRDAQLLCDAVDDDALDSYQEARDDLSTELFDLTSRLASYEWSLQTVEALLLQVSTAMRPEQEEMAARARRAQLPLAVGRA